jgi:putative pyruvate formate lyase activating enzyme
MIAKVSTTYLHFGEEKPLVGATGSGAIFFANCDLRCQFCQTARWNIQGKGQTVDPSALAALMLHLQSQGAVNINLVTPTHVAAQIVMAVAIAAESGLHLPLVWNSGGYDSLETLSLLDGIVDIYLPDMKYSDPVLASQLSVSPSYVEINRSAVLEMFRQVGHLSIYENSVACRGIIVRHLVMPGYLDNARGVLQWLASNLGTEVYLSLMDQYRPAYRAFALPNLNEPLSFEEYQLAQRFALDLGLTRLDTATTLESISTL